MQLVRICVTIVSLLPKCQVIQAKRWIIGKDSLPPIQQSANKWIATDSSTDDCTDNFYEQV